MRLARTIIIPAVMALGIAGSALIGATIPAAAASVPAAHPSTTGLTVGTNMYHHGSKPGLRTDTCMYHHGSDCG